MLHTLKFHLYDSLEKNKTVMMGNRFVAARVLRWWNTCHKKDKQGKFFCVIKLFHIVIAVVVTTQVYTCVKTHRTKK